MEIEPFDIGLGREDIKIFLNFQGLPAELPKKIYSQRKAKGKCNLWNCHHWSWSRVAYCQFVGAKLQNLHARIVFWLLRCLVNEVNTIILF